MKQKLLMKKFAAAAVAVSVGMAPTAAFAEEGLPAEGTETKTEEKTENVPKVTVALQPGESTTAASEVPQPEVKGDPQQGEGDEAYDQTTITETPREVTATMGEMTLITGDGADLETDKEIGLESIRSEWDESKEDITAPRPDQSVPAGEQPEGYDFYYSGWDEDSHFGVKYTDGEGAADYGDAMMFQLTDAAGQAEQPAEGEETPAPDIHTAYCVDLSTSARGGWWYQIENLEDAGYYPDGDAENHIRAIASHGYWGTLEGRGSLSRIKEELKAALAEDADALGGLTAADIDLMTEGEAQTATQMAIWAYGNQIRGELTLEASDYNGEYSFDSEDEDPENAAARNRIDQFAAYLTGLTEPKDETTDVITEEKFIGEMSLTIGDMVKGHENNADTDRDNDAYHGELSFALVVEPDGEKDDLVVKVVANGQVIRQARLAGDGSGDVGFDDIRNNGGGSYTFTDLELVENSGMKFSLSLEGAQYLQEGVYIYTSEVRMTENGEGEPKEASSQTFVGIAEGYRAVDVAMEVDLTFDVKEGTVTTERKWKRTKPAEEKKDPKETKEKQEEKEEEQEQAEETPVVEEEPVEEAPALPEEKPDVDYPLADVPQTGDVSSLWGALAGLSGLGLAGLKRRK